MINEEVLSEKLKYLIIMNAKPKQFEVINVYIEFEYTDASHEKLESYDIDVKFDYQGALDFDVYSFAHDIQRMTEKLRDVLHEYVLSPDGKLVNGDSLHCFSGEPTIFSIDYKVDETHIFDIGYRFRYSDD
jgi:UDP-N-acetylglucosamine 2-epimerase